MSGELFEAISDVMRLLALIRQEGVSEARRAEIERLYIIFRDVVG